VAQVIAVAGKAKAEAVGDLGAATVLDRETDLLAALAPESVDVVVDLVAGAMWPRLLQVLKRGGRYVVAGAIGGPLVELDVRTLYLKDLSLFGYTVLDEAVFGSLVGYIERGEIRPVVAETYPLSEIVTAQKAFLAKGFVGKIVLVPDSRYGC
jgi:NADPH:quinone reductase-like Zn-dependent oxidoreductase